MSQAPVGWRDHFDRLLAEFRQNELAVGRVVQATRKFCSILDRDCRQQEIKIPGRLHHEAKRGGLLPVVGDWILFQPGDEERDGAVERVLPRTTCISRQAPGRRHQPPVEQVIAANVDTVLIVCGLDRDYNPRRIERYLVLVGGSGADPVLVLNKRDLCNSLDSVLAEVASIAPGVPVHPLSAKSDDVAATLSPYLVPGKSVAVLGSSGVGKSTLVNRLIGYERQETGAVSAVLGKGTHTTTRRELFLLGNGAMLIDNPGMRELQLRIEGDELLETFEEIAILSGTCRFQDCRHENEPGCGVKDGVVRGEISEERYRSFLKLQSEAEQREQRQARSNAGVEKQGRRAVRKYQKRGSVDEWEGDA